MKTVRIRKSADLFVREGLNSLSMVYEKAVLLYDDVHNNC